MVTNLTYVWYYNFDPSTTNSVEVNIRMGTVHVKRLTVKRGAFIVVMLHTFEVMCLDINLLCVIKCYINTDNIFLGIKTTVRFM